MKISLTPSGMEPATFWLVELVPQQLRRRVFKITLFHSSQLPANAPLTIAYSLSHLLPQNGANHLAVG